MGIDFTDRKTLCTPINSIHLEIIAARKWAVFICDGFN